MLAAANLLARFTPDGGVRYLLPIELGAMNAASAQRVHVMLDTGSSFLMVLDDGQHACGPSEPVVYGSCYNASASSTNVDDASSGSSFGLAIDGLQIDGSFTAARDYLSLPGVAQADGPMLVPIAEIGTVSSGAIGPRDLLAYFWADAAGVLGLSPQLRTDRPQSWESYLQANFGSAFSLDLNPGGRSRLGLGPPNRSWAVGALQWSAAQNQPSFHRLEMFEIEMCGAGLIGAQSSYWPALVDTGASCVGLPDVLFDALFSWLAVANCSAPRSPTTKCSVPASVAPLSLPPLSFRLRHNAPPLELRLEELLLPAAPDGTREICILPLPPPASATPPWPAPWPQPIILGTQVCSCTPLPPLSPLTLPPPAPLSRPSRPSCRPSR